MKLLAFIVVLAVVTPAGAQPKADAEAAYKEGQARYLREDFEGAALQFKAAYDLDPDPVYLFNMGQAYRMAKKCLLSRESYQRYLDEAKTAPNADAVNAYIAEMDQCAKQQGEVVPPPVEESPPQPPAPPIVEEPPVERPSSSSSTRTIGIVVGIVGVVAVANGIYFATRVSDAESEANAIKREPGCATWNMRCDDRWDDVDRRGKRDEKIMLGSLIGGGAAIATGVVLFVLGRESSREVAVTPMRGGAAVAFSF